jgi:hypothetical protein
MLPLSLIVLGLATAADALLTANFVGLHGTDSEANPLVRWVIEQWGLGAMIVIKMCIYTGAAWVFASYHRIRPRVTLTIVWTLNLLHMPVIYWGWAMTQIS